MKCAIHQPQLLPWLGYLNKINSADVFVSLDNVQFKKNEFQNRNKVRVGAEPKWITAPVSFKFGDTIRETLIAGDPRWRKKMISTIEYNYGKTPFFKNYAPPLFEILNREWKNLAELNEATVIWLVNCFGIKTSILISSEMPAFTPDPTQRLIEICRHTGADVYLSGSGAREYLDMETFTSSGIALEFQDFLHPVYPQCYSDGARVAGGAFLSHLSAIDGLFNCGGDATGRKMLNI